MISFEPSTPYPAENGPNPTLGCRLTVAMQHSHCGHWKHCANFLQQWTKPKRRPVEREPNLIISSASQNIVVDGVPFKVDICKLEGADGWSLEVVTEDGTSIVWDDLFNDDQAAFQEALTTIGKEGPVAFVRGDSNIIPFKR